MKLNQLKSGILISYASLLVSNIIPFIYTPMMLRILGQEEYGIYGIANSIMGYLHLLNLGLGSTIIRYLSKYRAQKDKYQEEKVVGVFIEIYAVLGAVILVAGMIVAANIQYYGRSLTASQLEILRWLVVLMTVNTAFSLPFSVLSSVIVAHERYIFNKTVGLLTNIATPFLNLLFLYSGMGSIGLAVSSIVVNIVGYGLYSVYAVKRLDIHPRFGKPEEGFLKSVFQFSFFVFLASIVDVLYWSTDRLIIGWALGAASTAVYTIGSSFNGYVTSLSTAISGVLIPRLTQMTVNNAPKSEFTSMFIKVGRLQFIIISFILSAFIAFGRQFIAIWAGPGYEEAYIIALLTMVPVTVPLIQNTGLNILYAMNKHQFRSIVYFFIAVLNVVLTFLWVEKYGIIGAAAATAIAYVLGNILIMNWYYHKMIGIDIPLFWKNILKMSPTAVVMCVIWWVFLDHITVGTWSVFFLWAVVYSVMFVGLAYPFMMNDYEKDLLRKPLRNILKRIKSKVGGAANDT